ncbi:DUF115 domain-containing protein [bacterium]|nr:DUF115 domain-containing protein [bacterium]
MDIFRQNMEALARRSPNLARQVNQALPAAAEVTVTPSGAPSLRLLDAGGRPWSLHSAVDPLREAERLVEAQFTDSANACLVYGFGLGYHVDRLIERLDGAGNVLVVEPQISIFKAALAARDLRHLFGRDDIFWAVGETVDQVPAHFGEVFRVASLEGVMILPHAPSMRLCGDYFTRLDDLCRKWIIAVGGNFLTNVAAVRSYFSNTLDNILALAGDPPVKRLFGRFKGIPAVVISAGPSLDRNIHLLRLLERHAVLICVDTSLGPLHRAGVQPHLVLAGDAGENNFRHLKGLGCTGAALVAEPMTHPRIVSEFQGPRFTMSFDETLMKRLAAVLGDFGKVKAWGSISTGAFDLARRLGCDPIVFTGQDLSFPGLRYYAHGTYQERRWLREIGEGRTLQDMHNRRMVNENNLDATDIFGRPVRTSKALEAYRQYLEREISETGSRVINATEGGVGFAGVTNLPLDEVFWRYARRTHPVRQMILSCHSPRPASEKQAVYDFLSRSVEELATFCALCNDGFELARLIHQGQSPNPEADFASIEDVYAKVYNRKDVLELLEHANQGGLLAFQRGSRQLENRTRDRGLLEDAARLYGAFFISFYQTADFLLKRTERAALAVGSNLDFGSAEHTDSPDGEFLEAV